MFKYLMVLWCSSLGLTFLSNVWIVWDKYEIDQTVVQKQEMPIKNTIQKEDKKEDTRMIKYWFKDEMFKRVNVWKSEQWYDIVDYSQLRDLEEVDEIDVDKVYSEWVWMELKDKEVFKQYTYQNQTIPYYEISWWNKFMLIFIHWLDWNATRWFKDYTFRWNFNRIKHLAYYNEWKYLSPTIKNFWFWAKAIWQLIKDYKQESPDMKVLIACWSSWWETCWKIYDDTTIPLDWILLLWSMPPYMWIDSVYKRDIPIYYWHWEKDSAMSVNWSIWTFNKLKNDRKIKLEVFTNWVHWTPLRMVNWLEALQFMFNEEWQKVEDKSIWVPIPEHFDWIKEVYPNWVNLKSV